MSSDPKIKTLPGAWLLRMVYALMVRLLGLHNPRKTTRNIGRLADRSRTRLLIACLPKSGSTYSSRLLERLTGYPSTAMVYAYERTEQELYWPRFVLTFGNDALYIQQHIRCTKSTMAAIENLNITTIVQTRNILDVVVSLRDHLASGDFDASMAYVDDRFLKLSPEAQIDFIIDLIIPWYFNFFVSWHEAALQGLRVFWLSYEKLVSDPQGLMTELADFAGHPEWTAGEAVQQALQGAREVKTRFNKGVVGRGNDSLTLQQKNQIRRLASHYPGVDFRLLGLEPQ